jgi:alkyl hydroperoxide reductase subunit AhpF
MHLLREQDAIAVRARLGEVARPIRLVFFTEGASGLIIPGRECRYCGEAQRLLEDVASCSDQVTLEVHDRLRDLEAFTAYGIDRVPALVVAGAVDYGVRYYGLPAGYELAAVLDIIVDASRASGGLAPETAAALAALPADVHLQVFVTPT